MDGVYSNGRANPWKETGTGRTVGIEHDQTTGSTRAKGNSERDEALPEWERVGYFTPTMTGEWLPISSVWTLEKPASFSQAVYSLSV